MILERTEVAINVLHDHASCNDQQQQQQQRRLGSFLPSPGTPHSSSQLSMIAHCVANTRGTIGIKIFGTLFIGPLLYYETML